MKKELKKDQGFLSKLDEVLALIDPEEMIRDGVQYLKFRHEEKGKTITLTANEVKKIKKERKIK